MIIGDILQLNATMAPRLMEAGMQGIGCPASQGERLEQEEEVDGMDADELVSKINEFLATKN